MHHHEQEAAHREGMCCWTHVVLKAEPEPQERGSNPPSLRNVNDKLMIRSAMPGTQADVSFLCSPESNCCCLLIDLAKSVAGCIPLESVKRWSG